MKLKISLAFRKWSQPLQLVFGKNVIEKMSTGTQFEAQKKEVETLKNLFDVANNLLTGKRSPTREQTLEKDAAFKALIDQLEKVAKLVEWHADFSELLALSAGFEVSRNQNIERSAATVPTDFVYIKVAKERCIRLQWKKGYQNDLHNLEFRVVGTDRWQKISIVKGTHLEITDLELGVFYDFRINSFRPNDAETEYVELLKVLFS